MGETLGFVGALVLLTLYAFVIYRMLLLAFHTNDKFGQLIIVGVMAMLVFHVYENIGMCIGVMPDYGYSASVYQLWRNKSGCEYGRRGLSTQCHPT